MTTEITDLQKEIDNLDPKKDQAKITELTQKIAEAKAAENNKPTPAVSTVTQGVLPQATHIEGIVSSISSMLSRTSPMGKVREFCIVTIELENGGTKEFAINKKFMERNSALIQLDACVNLQYETTVAGVTGWANRETGEFKTHTYSGESVTSVTRVSLRRQQESLLESRAQKAEAKINAADDSKAIALATLYGSLYRV